MGGRGRLTGAVGRPSGSHGAEDMRVPVQEKESRQEGGVGDKSPKRRKRREEIGCRVELDQPERQKENSKGV